MVKKKKYNKKIKNEYLNSLRFVKNSKNFIYIIMIIFFITSLISFFAPTPIEIQKVIIEFIQDLIKQTEGLSQTELITFIFINNLQSSFLGMIFGIFLGFFPILTAIINGYILGYVAKIAVQKSNIFSLWQLFPHGIFEIPAIFISLGLGIKIGSSFFEKETTKTLKKNLLNSIKTFILLIIPLLIIAAIIEGTLIFIQK
ncbi:MAG: stage II sporulation protein M [Candidatus Pacearchaeota archaeon]|nr:stage II sporulation protein M [Candidatus Pacearchaeota archaeon]